MKFFVVAVALAAVGASAQSVSTVNAPCGTSCPTAVPDRTITRSPPAVAETTPCPSLIVSSVAGNGSAPSATGKPTLTSFTGGAAPTMGPVVAAVAAAGAAFAAFAL